jgi:hypothetical protein
MPVVSLPYQIDKLDWLIGNHFFKHRKTITHEKPFFQGKMVLVKLGLSLFREQEKPEAEPPTASEPHQVLHDEWYETLRCIRPAVQASRGGYRLAPSFFCSPIDTNCPQQVNPSALLSAFVFSTVFSNSIRAKKR